MTHHSPHSPSRRLLSDIPLIPHVRHVENSGGAWHVDSLSEAREHFTTTLDPHLEPGHYRLQITDKGAHASAADTQASHNARHTWRQLLELLAAIDGRDGALDIPCGTIHDAPDHAWRGLHVDPARHFIPVEQLRRIIDLAALYRLNIVHLHLNDDQGWRIEIDEYPRLSSIGAWRSGTVIGNPVNWDETDPYDDEPHGGIYTARELRALVEYARERGVMIVPEIDIPGHVQAAVAAYPEIGNFPHVQHEVRRTWGISTHVLGVSDAALDFVRTIFRRVCEIFDAPYIHIGGDEVPREEWEKNPDTPARLAEWGLSHPDDIQGYFTRLAHDVVSEYGRTIVGWDELLDAEVPTGGIIMNWRSPDTIAGALERGIPLVIGNCQALYFDFPQGPHEPVAQKVRPTTLRMTLEEPLLPPGVDPANPLILGYQGYTWSEYIPTSEHWEYMSIPRMFALAERAWSRTVPSWDTFVAKIPAHEALMNRLGYRFRPTTQDPQ